MLKYAAVITMTLAAVPAFAQSGATQSPPSPNASSSGPQAATSVPAGAMTANPSSTSNPHVSGALGASSTTGGTPMTTQHGAGASSSAMSHTVPKPAN